MGMPQHSNNNFEDHLKQALMNEELVSLIEKGCSKNDRNKYNWVFVLIYYSAMHYLHAIIVKKGGIPPTDHTGPNGDVVASIKHFVTKSEHLKYPDTSLGSAYETIFQYGSEARYNPKRSLILNDNELKEAKQILNEAKFIAINETGYEPIFIKRSKLHKVIHITKTRMKELARETYPQLCI